MAQFEFTPQQRSAIIKWLSHQTYSGESHRTDQGSNVEWLRTDEMNKYLPEAIENIINGKEK
jgi:hypothetical protein